MYKNGKTWVIDPTSKRKKLNGAEIQREFGQPGTQQVDNHEGPSSSEAKVNIPGGLSYQKDTAPFLLLTYLLGPFAILITLEGRRSKFWVSVGIGSGIASVILLWVWNTISPRLEVGSVSSILLIFFASLAILAAVTTWVRAVLIIGRHRAILVSSLPVWIKRPWATGTFGLVIPGIGLFIAGYVKRAACALWIIGIALLSTFILSNAEWIWGWNRLSASEVIPSHAIEYIFMGLAVVCVLGALTWIVQALDGARLAGDRSTRRGRNRSDLITVALLVAIVAFSVMFEPAFVAKALDRFAILKHQEGYQVIPLYAGRAAVHFDKSQPEYVLHAATFYDDLGQGHTARTMREELYERWKPCVSELKRYGLHKEDSVSSLMPNGEVALSKTKAGRKEERVRTWDQIKAIYGAMMIQNESKTTKIGQPRPAED